MSDGQYLTIPVSVGEVFDKITILELKLRHVRSDSVRKNIELEHELLSRTVADHELAEQGDLKGKVAALFEVNRKLWDIEDSLRLCEKSQAFGDDFVQLARSVYFLNDERAAIKKDINLTVGSVIVEEKLYADYKRG